MHNESAREQFSSSAIGMSEQYSAADLERAFFQALINEGKHNKVLSAKKSSLLYNGE